MEFYYPDYPAIFADYIPANLDCSLLLANANKLLTAVGITTKKLQSIEELCRVASSMFVAIYESMYTTRIEGIIRNPELKEDYEKNAQLVVDILEKRIEIQMGHITGKSIVNGNIQILSDLVDIFVRILMLASHSQDIGDRARGNLRNPVHMLSSRRSSDSITTRESTFGESAGEQRGTRGSRGGDSLIQQLFEKKAQDSLFKANKFLTFESKLEAARKRREQLLRAKERKLRASNQGKSQITRRSSDRRWQEDRQRESMAFLHKRSNLEHVMLRKVYKGLLARVLEWRIEEAKEKKEEQGEIEKQVDWDIHSLQQLFQHRLSILQRSGSEIQHGLSEDTKADRLSGEVLLKAIDQRHQKLLNKRKNTLQQRRSQDLLRRHESYKDLMAMLRIEDWQDLLRQS